MCHILNLDVILPGFKYRRILPNVMNLGKIRLLTILKLGWITKNGGIKILVLTGAYRLVVLYNFKKMVKIIPYRWVAVFFLAYKSFIQPNQYYWGETSFNAHTVVVSILMSRQMKTTYEHLGTITLIKWKKWSFIIAV